MNEVYVGEGRRQEYEGVPKNKKNIIVILEKVKGTETIAHCILRDPPVKIEQDVIDDFFPTRVSPTCWALACVNHPTAIHSAELSLHLTAAV